jgi:hypothetical protein
MVLPTGIDAVVKYFWRKKAAMVSSSTVGSSPAGIIFDNVGVYHSCRKSRKSQAPSDAFLLAKSSICCSLWVLAG